MVDDDNDNSSTFESLAGATTKLLSKIERRQTNDAQEKENPSKQRQKTKKSDGEHRRYVDQRLRELAAFERRAMGKRLKR